jgi:putative transcriptional regulator
LRVRGNARRSAALDRDGEVFAVRALLRDSQAAFARMLNVSPRTVQAWETNARRPSDAALKLPSVAKKNPEALLG